MIACTPPLLEVLNDSISSGKFVDTKIILFSRRNSSGTVCKPRALYANSSVLRTVPYFNDLLFGKFGEAESKSFSEPLEDTESADDYGYCSDSDLEEDEDGSTSSKVAQGQTTLARGNGSDPFNFPPIENKPPPTCGEYQEHPEKGKVIKIQDMAFITFQAFVLYLYTNSIEFAPYGTEDNRKPRSAEIISVSENSIPRPSPKSIYRLADKYDVPALKKLASESIRDNLKHCDIVGEIFSKFTSRYDEVRAMQINHLASVRFGGDGAVKKKLCDEIDEKVDAYVAGDLKHAAEAVSLLWEASKDRRPIAVPQNTSIFAPSATSPASWECLKPALIRSIREGFFANRKYWTRHSRAGKVLRPVFFSSVVAGKRLPQIDKLVKQYSGSDEYFEKDDRFEDSDCEGGPDRSGDSVSEVGIGDDGQPDQGTLSILTIGSFASWRSLFFYLCSGSIKFAPLKSEGLDRRAGYLQEAADKEPHVPPPCSPKVIHALAVILDMKPLRDLALKEIRSKITSANVVNEFFASPTSRRTEVMEMQYELLSDKFDDHNTNSSTVDLIKSLANGTRTQHGNALKFGLRQGFSRTRLAPVEQVPQPSLSGAWLPFEKKPTGRSTVRR